MTKTANNSQNSILVLAWVATIVFSFLPNILWQEWVGLPAPWLTWSKIGLLGLLILLSLFWGPAKALRYFFVMTLILILMERINNEIASSAWWQNWFPLGAAFINSMFGFQIRRLAVALVMTLALFLIYKHPTRFFLIKGNFEARASKESFLINEGTPWKRLGLYMAFFITLGTLAFLWLANRPSLAELSQALPFLPAVVILSAMNAFSEELSYRAAFLAPLYPAVGKLHSMLMTAWIFGVAHYYGVPYGILGVVMSFALGYMLSKSMLETKGFFWAWFIHFWQDVAIFSFLAIGAVIAGGG
jgi:membrane protease YdiL (CAAX protease family)